MIPKFNLHTIKRNIETNRSNLYSPNVRPIPFIGSSIGESYVYIEPLGTLEVLMTKGFNILLETDILPNFFSAVINGMMYSFSKLEKKALYDLIDEYRYDHNSYGMGDAGENTNITYRIRTLSQISLMKKVHSVSLVHDLINEYGDINVDKVYPKAPAEALTYFNHIKDGYLDSYSQYIGEYTTIDEFVYSELVEAGYKEPNPLIRFNL